MNSAGTTPLEIWLQAPRQKTAELVRVALLLVDRGVDTTLSTSTGKTLFDMISLQKWLPKEDQVSLTKAFLKAGGKGGEKPRENVSRSVEWAEIWCLAWKQSRWQAAKACLFDLQYLPSRPKPSHFLECATIVLMEHQLETHKSQLKAWLEGQLDKEIVADDYEDYCAILRDCRERLLEIDVSWFTFLLDLMDFK